MACADLRSGGAIDHRRDRVGFANHPVASGGDWVPVSRFPRKELLTGCILIWRKYLPTCFPDLPDGHTPHQFGTALTRKLKSVKLDSKRVFSPVEAEIERVVALYVTQVFSGQPPSKSQINKGIRTWNSTSVGDYGSQLGGTCHMYLRTATSVAHPNIAKTMLS